MEGCAFLRGWASPPILSDQYDRLQKTLLDAEDKIQILRDEKLFIVQEKFHLEGQLKHFVARA